MTDNIPWDLMHDVLESLCKYDMVEILIHVTVKQKYVTLETINLKVDGIDFQKIGLNKPPLLKHNHLERDYLSFSASEVKKFCVSV